MAATKNEVAADPDLKSWFCFEGEGFCAQNTAILGVSDTQITCTPGEEAKFFEQLADLEAANTAGSGYVLAFAYEFGQNLNFETKQAPQATAHAFQIPAYIEYNKLTKMAKIKTFARDGFGKENHANDDAYVELFLTKPDAAYTSISASIRTLKKVLQTAQNMQNSQHTKEAQNTQTVQNTENARNAQTAQKVQSSQNTQSSQNVESLNKQFNLDHGEYLAAIESAKTQISAGDAQVICLTNKITMPDAKRYDPISTFLNLTQTSDAPWSGLIAWADSWLISASPESFIEQETRVIKASPIKGTRERAALLDKDVREDTLSEKNALTHAKKDALVEDAKIAAELLASTKERAENNLVLSEVLKEMRQLPETENVMVTSNGHIESTKLVHQLVSVAEARLKKTPQLAEILKTLHPAASMTGVPKSAAVSVLSDLEKSVPRGWYSGSYGIAWNGFENIKLATTIRSIEFDGQSAQIGAGGGITNLSDAEAEWDEMRYKARAMLQALETFENKAVS